MKLLLDLVVGESADHPARDRPDRDRREHRRREQAHREPDAAAPACPLAAEVVARLLHGDAAVFRVRDEDHALDLDFLLLDERDERLEVLRRLVDVLVTGNEDIGGCLSHQGSPFDSDWQRGSRAVLRDHGTGAVTEHRPAASSPG